MKKYITSLRLVITGFTAISLSACATYHPPPPTGKPPQNVVSSNTIESPLNGQKAFNAWDRLLKTHVTPDGRVDFPAIAKDPGDLHLYVAYIAQTKTIALSPSEAVARHVNAYNALAIYNLLRSGKLPEQKLAFFVLQKFDVPDNQRLSLYTYENKIIRKLNEPRTHFILNCLSYSCPRLLPEAISPDPDTLERQLESATREFFNDPKHITVDDAKKTVTMSAIMDWYKADYLTQSPTLIAYANRYRDTPIPEDYKVAFMKYDWTLIGDRP